MVVDKAGSSNIDPTKLGGQGQVNLNQLNRLLSSILRSVDDPKNGTGQIKTQEQREKFEQLVQLLGRNPGLIGPFVSNNNNNIDRFLELLDEKIRTSGDKTHIAVRDQINDQVIRQPKDRELTKPGDADTFVPS